MNISKFSETAHTEKPDTETTRLLERVMQDDKLNRQEKNKLADILYGTFSPHSPVYRLHGWAWYMQSYLPRFLVSFNYGKEFNPYYAHDKTALRKVLHSVAEIVKA